MGFIDRWTGAENLTVNTIDR